MNYPTITMKRAATEQAVRDGAPGAFCIAQIKEGEATFQRLWAHLPHGEVVGFNLAPTPPQVPFPWQWNGSEKKPTLWRDIGGKKRGIALRGRWCGQIKAGRMVGDPIPVEPQAAPAQPQLPPPSPIAAALRAAKR